MIVQWLLYASAVTALLAVAAWALEAVLLPRRKATRWAWLAAMLLSIALPAARLTRPAPATEPAGSRVAAVPESRTVIVEPMAPPAVAAVAVPALPAPLAPAAREPLLDRLEAIAAPLWLGMSGTLALLLLLGRAQLLRRSRRWRSAVVDGERVLLSADTGPAVIGVVRSSIVLPEWVLGMEAEERGLILQHERAHIAARDPMVVALGMAAVLLTPWNAPLWWLLRRLRLAIETDCDARVLRREGQVGGYARLLLSLAERSAGDLPLGAAAFAEPRSFLERRIRAMITPRPSRRRGLAAGLLAAALVPMLAFRLPSPPPVRQTPMVTTRALAPVTAARSARASVDAPALPGDPVEEPQGPADTLSARFDPEAVNTLAQREFPQEMRERGIDGRVTLRFTVDRDGKARNIEATAQSGLEFVEPAKRVVQQLQFAPARVGNQAVAENVTYFDVRFRLRASAARDRGEPSDEEVLLRAAIERYYPELLRQETARQPWVYLVVDERGNVLRHALDWVGRTVDDYSKAIPAKFPELAGRADALETGLPVRVRTGIPRGRDIEVYWAVLRQGGPRTASWGPYPLSAVAPGRVPIEVVRRAVRERYPDVLQRGRDETIWFVGYPDGHIVATGRGSEAEATELGRSERGGYTIVAFETGAEGGTTRIHWTVPGEAAPSEPDVITGTVRDAAGNPVAGAVVLLRDRQLGATTGADGRFAFRAAAVAAGTHAVLARHPAGAPAATRQVTFRPGSSATVDFVLPAR